MCLRPVRIYNPTKNIAACGGQKLLLDVRCNKCADCLENKRQEWHFRTYHQALDCIRSGGYVYFDTLTYDEMNVPHLHDFLPCDLRSSIEDFTTFNLLHFKNFLKNLRRQLDYHYNGYGLSLKYFLTSEYGTDPRYTHRPHYHILFFIYGRIHPLAFSRLVAKCWKYGRTDGIDFQPMSHVASHIYGYDIGYGANDLYKNVNLVSNYVSKYITKDSDFASVIESRLTQIEQLSLDDELIKNLKRNVDFFHRQSKGFGLSYLDALHYDKSLRDDIENGVVRFRGDDGAILRTMPLPMYYQRHLFYVQKRRPDKTYYWELTEFGREHKLKNMFTQVTNLEQRYQNIMLNLPDVDRQTIYDYLNGRSFLDFAFYKTFYQGRLRCHNGYNVHTNRNLRMFPEEYNLSKWLRFISLSFMNNDSTFVFKRNDNDEVIYEQFKNNMFYFTNEKTIPYETFAKRFTFNENTVSDFNDFDKLDRFFKHVLKPINNLKQTTFDEKEKLVKRFKQYGIT